MKVRDHYLFLSRPIGVHVDPTTQQVTFTQDGKIFTSVSLDSAIDNVKKLLVHLNQVKEKLCS